MSGYGNSYGDVVGASQPAPFAEFNYLETHYALTPSPPPRHTHSPIPPQQQHYAVLTDIDFDIDVDAFNDTDIDLDEDIIGDVSHSNGGSLSSSSSSSGGNILHTSDIAAGQDGHEHEHENEHGPFPPYPHHADPFEPYGNLTFFDSDDSASEHSVSTSTAAPEIDLVDQAASSDHDHEPEADEDDDVDELPEYDCNNYMSSPSSHSNSTDIEAETHAHLRLRSIRNPELELGLDSSLERDQLQGLAYNFGPELHPGVGSGASFSSGSSSGSNPGSGLDSGSGSRSDPPSLQSDTSNSASDSTESVYLSDRSSGPPDSGPHQHLLRHPGAAAAAQGRYWPSRSPHRLSLIPTIHPNRRLPQPQQHAVDGDLDSNSPMEAVLRLREPYRVAHPTPTRTSPGANSGRFVDLSDEDDQPLAARRVSSVLLQIAEDSDNWDRPLATVPRQSPQQQPLRPHSLSPQLDHPDHPGLSSSPFSWRQPGAGAGAANMNGDDELIEIVMEEQSARAVQRPRINGVRNQQRVNVNDNHANPANTEIIDLTEDPDSPDANPNHRTTRPQPANAHTPPRHSRRHVAPNGRASAFARSVGSFPGSRGGAPGPAPVIDLTSDSPQAMLNGEIDSDNDSIFGDGNWVDVEPQNNIPANRRLPAPIPNIAQRNRRRSAELLGFGRMLGNFAGFLPGLLAGFGAPDVDVQVIDANRHNPPPAPNHNHPPPPNFVMNANPLAGNLPVFNYQGNGFGGLGGGHGAPKPPFEPPRSARPGFTRNTGPGRDTSEQMVIVCASCDNELKYSTDDEDDGPRPAKRVRTKKDREEHHFWAVRNCGHVYCKSCYDNRKKTKSKAYEALGFQVDASSRAVKIFCAVNGCTTDVSANNAWVGIFM